MGSVIKRGQRWYAVVDVVPSQNGKRRDQRKIVLEASITTKKDATIALARIVTEMNGGQFVLPSKLTVAQLLRDHWLPHKALSASAKTIEGYREKVEGRLIPAFGSTLVSKLHQARIQQAYDEWIKSGLSAQTVKHHHSVLRNAMRYAVRMGLATNVVTDRVKPPTPQHVEMVALNEEQSLLLLEDVRDTWMRVPVALGLFTGLRRGELCGLRWKDLDFKQSRLQVRQALEITRSIESDGSKSRAVLSFKSPKTAKSRRAFKVGENVMQALRRHRSIQNEERLAFEGAYQDNDLVFCKADGSPINPDKFSHDFAEMVKKQARFPKLRLHDLRHSFATQMLRAGVHFKVVSEMLGHASVAITLDRYSHVLEGMDADAADALDRLYGRIRTA